MINQNLSKKIRGIYAITPNTVLDLAQIEHLIKQHSISILQYRHKTAAQTPKLTYGKQLQRLCAKYHTLFIVNDDINLAKRIAADGVHLGKNDTSILAARQQLGNNAIIGISCYDKLNLAQQAQDQGADYVAFGALFRSKTKPNAPHCPLTTVSQAKQQLTIPIVGIGGIDFNNQQAAFAAGCDAVAMIDALFKSTDSIG